MPRVLMQGFPMLLPPGFLRSLIPEGKYYFQKVGGWAFFAYSCLNDLFGFEKPECQARGLVFFAGFVGLWLVTSMNPVAAFVVSYLVFLSVGGYKFYYIIYRSVGRDLRGLYRLIKMRAFIRRCRKKNYTIGDLFRRLVRKNPDKICFMHEDKKWTFLEVENYSNQVANCFAELGFRRGDDIALFMESKPEFVAIWLGLSKIGVVPALINSNLRLQPLQHSITVVNCKAVIFGSELISAVKEVSPLLKDCSSLQYFCLGDFDPVDFPARSLDLMIQESSVSIPSNESLGNMDDRLFYVYTSGTTGLPKAAIIRHSRFVSLGVGIHYMTGLQEHDVIYTALPLYHTAGGILSMSQTLLFGSTLAIRTKFSASKFWEDAIKFKATASQYIGELCRYLLAQPFRPEEKQHGIRLMFGNGLRPQIWPQFVERFGIDHVRELYGSTEGNANVMNIDNKVGSVGFLSRIIPTVYPVTLIRVDPTTGEPIRDKNGLCMRCEPGEPGEFVGKIICNDPTRSFDGYVNQSATKKKIVRDCFRKGDTAFLSGDLLMMDEDGYLYFMDRTGDTFRWRGENVSTTEVESVMSNILGLKDCVVYGVQVPDNEGRAGMVAIHDPENTIDLGHLATEAMKVLPSYAVPLFLRVCDELESTGTFKLKKVDLQKQGFNPNLIKDPLYYLDRKLKTYSLLDEQAYADICDGRIRL